MHLSRLETPTGTKRGPFIPIGGSNRDKRLRGPFVPIGVTNRDKKATILSRLVPPTGTKGPCPPLARLAVGPGTKGTFCPGPKGSRDKWSRTKACSVVVDKFSIAELIQKILIK